MPGETYIVIDIETDGPIPGDNSMLSLGACAVTHDLQPIESTFYQNILPLEGAAQDPDTMSFWAKNPEAWGQLAEDAVKPREAMQRFVEWHRSVGTSKKVLVAFPSGFDFTFVYWYGVHFFGRKGFRLPFSCLDMKTFGMALGGKPYLKSNKKGLPKEWFGPRKHTHHALDDALEQRDLFVSMMKVWRKMHAKTSVG